MRKVLLIILDGWGHSDLKGIPDQGNAVELADIPVYRRLYGECARTRLACSGQDVGLPDGQMGNSEVGHLNLGAGRVVDQDIVRIDRAIAEGTFASHLGLPELVTQLRERSGTLHITGLMSDGGVHSHLRHLTAIMDLLPRDLAVRVHCFTDGRDTSPTGGASYLAEVEALTSRSEEWRIASVIGRYWAMDRDHRWDRIKKAYDLIARGESDEWAHGLGFLRERYASNVTDEFELPTGIRGAGEAGIRPKDTVITINFRADRMRQLVSALGVPSFDNFEREVEAPADIVTMTEYESDLPVKVAFPPIDVRMGLSEVLAGEGLRQLKAAETEKYAHVTYFFNGGGEAPFTGEERALIPSPKVATYDLRPEMSAQGVTEAVINGVRNEDFNFILVNFANPDMVGHTGSIPAAVEAVQAVDGCLGKILEEIEAHEQWVALVTADHGNCENMVDKEGNPHTAHTTEPVDFIIYDPTGKVEALEGPGKLADVAPTVLGYIGIAQPKEMTGRDLVAR